MFGFGGGGDGDFAVLNASGAPKQIAMPSAIKKVGEYDELMVKQRMSKLEQLCSCWESKNKYDIYNRGSRIFYAEEKTTCTCCCINRPVVEMFDKNGHKFGSIKDPCPLCPGNMNFELRDHEDNRVLYAESGLCQWGLCCPCPCGPCKKVEFPVKDNDGNEVGMMEKHMKGWLKMCLCSSCFDDVENYKIISKNIRGAREKTLLLGLAIFTDFRYFSNTGDDSADPAE